MPKIIQGKNITSEVDTLLSLRRDVPSNKSAFRWYDHFIGGIYLSSTTIKGVTKAVWYFDTPFDCVMPATVYALIDSAVKRLYGVSDTVAYGYRKMMRGGLD